MTCNLCFLGNIVNLYLYRALYNGIGAQPDEYFAKIFNRENGNFYNLHYCTCMLIAQLEYYFIVE